MVPVFVYRPWPDMGAKERLEALIADEGGEVCMEAEAPAAGRIMLLVGFETDFEADAFVGLANCLTDVTAEKSAELRVAGEVLYG